MTRPLSDFQPCADCLAELEAARARIGESGYTPVWCEHRQIFAAWSLGDLVLRPCATGEEALRSARIAEAMIRQQSAAYAQLVAERQRSGPTN